MSQTPAPLTVLFDQARDGRPASREALVDALYDRLRAMAGSFLQDERSGHTLQPTALVNEAWIHLARSDNLDESGKTLFLAAAATTFRRLLIDYARQRNAQKRGGGALRISFEDAEHALPFPDASVEALNAALEGLEAKYPRQHQVVELKYFAGLPVRAIAEVLGVSERTVANDLDFSRAWLKARMAEAT